MDISVFYVIQPIFTTFLGSNILNFIERVTVRQLFKPLMFASSQILFQAFLYD